MTVQEEMSEFQGITTRIALQRLKLSMQEALSRKSPFSWLKTVFASPAQLISLTLTVLCGLLLVLAGALSSDAHAIQIAEGCILVLFAILGYAIHAREVYSHENFAAMKVQRAVARVSKLIHSAASEESVGLLKYPSNEIVTVRGYLTTPTYRDGSVVNVPNNLLAEGDVILLGPDRPSPAYLQALEKGRAGIGGKPDSSLRSKRDTTGSVPEAFTVREGQKITFDQLDGESPSIIKVGQLVERFRVVRSPFSQQLQTILDAKQRQSLLNDEISFTMKCLFYLLIFLLFGVTLLINVARFAALPEDFSSWSQMLLTETVYVVLPVLLFQLPLFRACVSAYGTASVVQLCTSYSSTLLAASRERRRDGMTFVARFCQILTSPFYYAGWRLFHVFGSTTILCCMDKEHVLCHPRPVPDRVFFLHSQEDDDQTASNRQASASPSVPVKANEETKLENETVGRDSRGVKTALQPCEDRQPHNLPVSVDSVSQRKVLCKDGRHSVEEADEEDQTTWGANLCDDDKNPFVEDYTGLHVKFKDLDSQSVASMDLNVNINTEILALSSRMDDPGEICFDDINWRDFLDSVKSVGFTGASMSHRVQQLRFTTAETLSSSLLCHLQATDCLCSLGKEIGVSDHAINTFAPSCKSILSVSPGYLMEPINSVSSRVSQWSSTQVDRSNESLLYMFTAIFKVADAPSYQLVTRSHSDFTLACCQDFWNGSDIMPLGRQEKRRIKDFFARRSLLAHAVVLSYNPFLEYDPKGLPDHTTLLVPYSQLSTDEEAPFESLDSTALSGEAKNTYTPSELFKIQCGQIFLGIVSLQHQPYQDVVCLIEDLSRAGIRFVHFSAESELRENVFSERMGLETGWNCHISLASDTSGKNADEESLDPDGDPSFSRSSSDSSLGKHMQGKNSYIRAKLPRGVGNIRPHIENVDNVPLLVPLFTDCQPEGIREMIEIMQENGEVVTAIGNAWNSQNVPAFAQADVSVALIPGEAGLQCLADMCAQDWDKPSSLATFGSEVKSEPALELATELNTLPCQYILPRHAEVSIMEIVSTSRHFLSCTRHSLLLSLNLLIVLALLMFLGVLLFLPPPLSGSQLFHFVLFTVPALAVWMLSVKIDPDLKKLVLDKNKVLWAEKWRFLVYFCLSFLPTAIISIMIFGLSVGGLCVGLVSNSTAPIANGTCHLLLGDRNQISPWNGWDGVYRPELLIAQGINAVFLSLCAVVVSLHFLHRTLPVWRLYRFVPIYQFFVFPLLPVLHVVHAVAAYFVTVATQPQSSQRAQVGDVPWYVWVFCIGWLVLLFPILGLIKRHDSKLLRKAQRFLRLEFETKLGMNSPF